MGVNSSSETRPKRNRPNPQYRPPPRRPEPVNIESTFTIIHQVDRSNNFNNLNSRNNILTDLKCPVCHKHLSAPIFVCVTGHNICVDCKNKLVFCPICKSSLTNQRNSSLESVCRTVSHPCINSKYGCGYRGNADNTRDHMKTCEFQQYLCPIGMAQRTCFWTGSRSCLAQHFSDTHPNKTCLRTGVEVAFDSLDVTKPDSDLQLITFRNSLFLYHVRVNPQDQVATWAIQHVGGPAAAVRWKYEFKFYSKTSRKQIRAVEECTSSEIDVDLLYSVGDCVSVPLHVLKKLIEPSNRLTFVFYVNDKNDLAAKSNQKNNQPHGNTSKSFYYR